jgi:AAA15 family ATPase/GTPase
LFLSRQLNPNNAQLIFASHDTNLLHYSHLRRDQINFVEKNTFQGTEVYSLSDFRYFNNQKERPDVDKEKRYLEGRYGAVPVLGHLNQKISDWYGEKR